MSAQAMGSISDYVSGDGISEELADAARAEILEGCEQQNQGPTSPPKTPVTYVSYKTSIRSAISQYLEVKDIP